MAQTLSSPKIASFLQQTYAQSDSSDPLVLKAIQQEADAHFGGQRYHPALTHLFDQAIIPVPPEVGQLLYALTRTKQPASIVEIGTSFGISAIHFAAALKDNGKGRLISAELSETKAKAAEDNLRTLGLSRFAEIRRGDALETLKDLTTPIDILFLDGWKDFYLPILQALETKLAPCALVIGDDTNLFPERLASYLAYVRDPANNYLSIALNLGDGVELSVRTI